MFSRSAFAATVTAAAVASLALAAPVALRAQGNCPNCDLPPGCRGVGNQKPKPNPKRNCQTLAVSVESDIDFGRVVMLRGGEGRVLLDLTTGERRVIGDVDDLGGVAITGRATVTGAPLEVLRISLPGTVTMTDATGGEARIDNFVTDLPALPVLDANGQLTFGFAGTLVISAQGGASGRLRGRVPINVEYP